MTSVLVDARELGGDSATSGVGTFIRGLLGGLAARSDTDVRALATRDLDLPAHVTAVPIRRHTSGGRRAVLEHEVLLPFDLHRDKAAVFHNPLFHPPWHVGRPWVQTLHDVIPLVYPDPNLDVLRKRWRRFAPRYRRADTVVAVSRHAADEGIHHLGLDAARVEVVPHGVDPRFHPGTADGPDGEPYVLVVSEYSRRKGFDDAFAVIADLADAGLPHRLKVVGWVPPHVAAELDQLVRSSTRPDRIDVLGFVPDLAALYRGAELVLVPSRYEGFGLPALEAMASGAPLIAYDNSSLPEVVGDGGVLVADGDVAALANAARSVLTEPAQHAELRERGPAQAAGFTWDAAAARYAEIYRQVGLGMSRLPVAIDTRRLQDDPPGGAGRALAGILPGLAARCDVTLLADGRRSLPAAVLDRAPGVAVVALRLPPKLPETVWLHGPARRWLRRHPRLFHGTFAALPAGLRGPSVVTVNDLSFELHDEDFGTGKRTVFRLHARAAVRRARTTITPSTFSADQVVARYGVPAARVEVIPIAVDPAFGPARATDRPTLVPELGSRPYVLAVGGARRRGLQVAVQAWRDVRDRGVDVDLAVVGEPGLAIEPGLHDLGRPDDAAWAAVLAGASALCYPTRYEGFGLPALEAAASGTPVVCARVASLPEVLGDAAAWCDEPTVGAIADRLHAVLTDAGLAADLRARGLVQATAGPAWDDIAALHVAVYEAAST